MRRIRYPRFSGWPGCWDPEWVSDVYKPMGRVISQAKE